MPAPLSETPHALLGRPVTTAEAIAAGVSRDVLSRRWTRLFRGVWWFGERPSDAAVWVEAARLLMPPDAVVSHVTALRLHGVEAGELFPLHFSHAGQAKSAHQDIRLHRRRAVSLRLDARTRCTDPLQAFLDSATVLSVRDLVRAGDALVRRGLATQDSLRMVCQTSSASGARRALGAASLVRERVDSVKETDLRLLLHCAGLPEPICNLEIFDAAGFVARSDLVYPDWKVVVEYDGWHHERSARQRRKDVLRRERLEAAGWRVVTVTSRDLDDPVGLVRRIHRVLTDRGSSSPTPDAALTWQAWRDIRA